MFVRRLTKDNLGLTAGGTRCSTWKVETHKSQYSNILHTLTGLITKKQSR